MPFHDVMIAYADIILTTQHHKQISPGVFIALFVGFIIIGAIFSYIREKKRREALQLIAGRLGLSFSRDKDRSLAGRYGFLNKLDRGRNRYAYNVMQGTATDGSPVCLFDYHYETKSRDSKGRTKTNHYYFSVFALTLPQEFPELIIEPEGFFAKIAQALGFDDIDFESVEFSKRYKVKSPDKKFAYDVCNAQMIDYLLRQENLAIELESNVLAMIFRGRMKPDNVEPNYQRLQKIRSLMPNYLFTGQPA